MPTGDVTIHNLIPATHTHRRAIEDAVRALLSEAPGSWTVAIVPEASSPFWLITIEGPKGFRRMLMVGPAEQNPEALRDCVMEVLSRGE